MVQLNFHQLYIYSSTILSSITFLVFSWGEIYFNAFSNKFNFQDVIYSAKTHYWLKNWRIEYHIVKNMEENMFQRY